MLSNSTDREKIFIQADDDRLGLFGLSSPIEVPDVHIPITDLGAASRRFPPELFRAPGDVHFKPDGRKKLAKLVAAKIEEALEK